MPAPRAKLPKNHRLILDIVEESGVGTHLTAYDLLLRARSRQPNIGMATVHRALGQLADQRLLAKVLIAGFDAATYEPIADQHAHFRCTACGALIDLDYAVPKPTLAELSARFGLRVDEEHVTLSGLCGACVRTGAPRK